MTTNRSRDPLDDLIDAALARQRAALAADLDGMANDREADADPHWVAGLRHAAARVRDGRSRPSEAT